MAQQTQLFFEQPATFTHPQMQSQADALPQVELAVLSFGDQLAGIFAGKHWVTLLSGVQVLFQTLPHAQAGAVQAGP